MEFDDGTNTKSKIINKARKKSKNPLTVEMLKKLRKKCESISIKPIIINGKKVFPYFFNLPITDEMQKKIDDGEVFLFNQNIFNNQQKEGKMKVNLEIAKICHEANREYCIDNQLRTHAKWDELPNELQESIIAGVAKIIENPKITAEEMHEAWMEYKAEEGWIYGEEIDVPGKTHPNMAVWKKLSKVERGKDKLFLYIVKREMNS